MYWHGLGVEKDYVEAYKWACVAGVGGAEDATLIDSLKSVISAEQIREAQRRAKQHVDR